MLNYRKKWTKTTWKSFEGTIRRSQNKSIEVEHVADDDNYGDDDDVCWVVWVRNLIRPS
jgi:hypothetical protein